MNVPQSVAGPVSRASTRCEKSVKTRERDNPVRILVIEDNRDILANVLDYLQLKGFSVDCAQDGLTGLHLASTGHYDLIVLDIMLPGIDGYQVCKRLREDGRNEVPILMLTARDALDDRLQGLKAGADDYLIKPFALSELVARIEAILRRSQGSRKRQLKVADLVYDLDTLHVSRAGQPLKLNPLGLKLLAVLMQKSPAVVRREALEEAFWGDDCPDSDSLRSHIHQLRQVLDKPFAQPLLHTLHGVGYRLAEQTDGV
jgi:DNA-binding response OmpR family regulator